MTPLEALDVAMGWADEHAEAPIVAEPYELAYDKLRELGFVIAPVEPTKDMIGEGCAVDCVQCHADCEKGPYAKIYRAMIEESQK